MICKFLSNIENVKIYIIFKHVETFFMTAFKYLIMWSSLMSLVSHMTLPILLLQILQDEFRLSPKCYLADQMLEMREQKRRKGRSVGF